MNNSRILTIKNAKFSGFYFYKNLNRQGDFQICISLPFMIKRAIKIEFLHYTTSCNY